LKFLLAFTRAGFDSQLTLNCLGLLLRGKGLLAVELRPIQSSLRFFFTSKKARVLERGCIRSKKGAICLIFEGDMPPKKYTPKSGAVNGTINGILLSRSNANENVHEKHLLWGLIFLNAYAPNEEIHCAIVGFPTRKEFRQKAWHIIVGIIAALKDGVIQLENRFVNAPDSKGIPFLTAFNQAIAPLTAHEKGVHFGEHISLKN
jgi:hypothetical protein